MAEFDQAVFDHPLWEAARKVLPNFAAGWQFALKSPLPKDKPILAIANHPGAADSLAALAALERPDVNFLVIKRPMLAIMPNISQHMIYLEEYNPVRVNIIRDLIHTLQKRETLLMFPRGNLEPDPALYPGALDSLQQWSQSIGLILSRVPETVLQPILISQVVAPRAWRHPVARMGKTTKTRHQIAMLLQTAMQQLFKGWKIPVKVTLPSPVPARELAQSLDPHALNKAVLALLREEMSRISPFH